MDNEQLDRPEGSDEGVEVEEEEGEGVMGDNNDDAGDDVDAGADDNENQQLDPPGGDSGYVEGGDGEEEEEEEEEYRVPELFSMRRTFHRRSRKFNVMENVFELNIAPFPNDLTYAETVERLHTVIDGKFI